MHWKQFGTKEHIWGWISIELGSFQNLFLIFRSLKKRIRNKCISLSMLIFIQPNC